MSLDNDDLFLGLSGFTSEISPGPPPFVGILKGRFENGGLMVGLFKIFKTFISQVVPNAFGNEFQILAAVELKLCRLL